VGDRRDYFESLQDTWDMTKMILAERERREIDPTLPVLEACLEECQTAKPPDPQVTERLHNMLDLFRTMHDWHGEIMRLPSSQLKRLVGMRQKVRKLLRFGALAMAVARLGIVCRDRGPHDIAARLRDLLDWISDDMVGFEVELAGLVRGRPLHVLHRFRTGPVALRARSPRCPWNGRFDR
jgi:hypothetical protein